MSSSKYVLVIVGPNGLIISINFPDKKMREILFIKETSEEIAIWEGNKLTKEEARKISGIESVMWNDNFKNVLS